MLLIDVLLIWQYWVIGEAKILFFLLSRQSKLRSLGSGAFYGREEKTRRCSILISIVYRQLIYHI